MGVQSMEGLGCLVSVAELKQGAGPGQRRKGRWIKSPMVKSPGSFPECPPRAEGESCLCVVSLSPARIMGRMHGTEDTGQESWSWTQQESMRSPIRAEDNEDEKGGWTKRHS